MLELYGYEINSAPGKQELEELLCRVSACRREKLNGMASGKNRLQSLYGDLLARYLGCSRLGLSNTELVISRNEHGKPFIAGQERFHFSISHTGDIVLVGVSHMDIGVDIEGQRNACPKLAGRFFTDSEAAFISEGEPEWERRFFEIWTRKEAYLKWTGAGLTVPLTSFDVTGSAVGVPIHTFWWKGYAVSYCGEERYIPGIRSLSHDFMQKAIANLDPIIH